MSRSSPLNPDHALIREFLAGDGTPRPFDANPLARPLGTRLLAADARVGSYIARGRIQRMGSRLVLAKAGLAFGDTEETVATTTGVMSLRQGPHAQG